jgi:hypothetical protein
VLDLALANGEIPANSKPQAGKKKYCDRGLDSGSKPYRRNASFACPQFGINPRCFYRRWRPCNPQELSHPSGALVGARRRQMALDNPEEKW